MGANCSMRSPSSNTLLSKKPQLSLSKSFMPLLTAIHRELPIVIWSQKISWSTPKVTGRLRWLTSELRTITTQTTMRCTKCTAHLTISPLKFSWALTMRSATCGASELFCTSCCAVTHRSMGATTRSLARSRKALGNSEAWSGTRSVKRPKISSDSSSTRTLTKDPQLSRHCSTLGSYRKSKTSSTQTSPRKPLDSSELSK